MEKVSVSLFPIMPPAREIGSKCLSKVEQGGGLKHDSEGLSVQEKLSAAWEAYHDPHAHETSPPILPLPAGQVSLNHTTVCQKAGQCLCSEGKRATREFRAALASAIKKLCINNSPGRMLYDSGRLVLRLSSFAADGCVLRVHWFFIGFGNLLDSVFCVKPLQLAGADGLRMGLPEVPDDLLLLYAAGTPCDLAVVADRMLPAASCTLELCALVVDSDIMFPNLYPVVAVRRGDAGAPFWPPQQVRRSGNRLLPIHARNLPAAGRGRGGRNRQAVPAIRDAPDCDDDDDDVTAGDGCVLDVLQDAEYAEAGDLVAPWSFDDSESDVSDTESPQPPLPRPPPPPAAPPPPPAAPPHDVVRARRVAHRDYTVSWPKMVHSVNDERQFSYLRVSRGHGARFMDMRALCSHHQPRCQFSSTVGGRRPVGHLWSWLNAAEDYTSKQGHQDARFAPEVASYDARVAARAQFEMLPGCDDWLEAEHGGVGLPEPRDTWRI